MKISIEKLRESLSLTCLTEVPERDVEGVYAGDLLSWVMSHASCGDAWVTIMSNPNVIAVASLVDVACVILTEGVTLEENEASLARDKGICVFTTAKSTFDVCRDIAALDV